MTRARRVQRVRRAVAVGVAVAALAWSAVARSEPVRILVAAGHKLGLAAEQPLKYADNDAARVRDVLVGMGGVRAENAFVLAEPTRAQLFAAIDRARDVAQKHAPDEVTLVLYFSGHGDREALHLGDDRVLMSDLSTKLAEVPASLRIAITDACRTNRDKGFVADEPFAISPLTSTQASGQVWLHASREGEAAQESDELQGAIFTHAWLNGLRGAADANGDARVTLDESFAFAHAQTLIRSAKSSGVVQKPEAVVSLHELAPVVLTQTATSMAILSLPAARDTHFLVYPTDSKTVWSELWSSPDRRISLAVPPGRYAVQRHAGGKGGATQIALAAGEERKLEDRDFGASAAEPLARKGDAEPDAIASPAPAIRHHEISAGYDVGADSRTGLVQGPRATYAFAWSRLALSVGAGADFSGRTLANTQEHLATGFGRVTVELRVPAGLAEVRLGGGARAGWLHQSLEPTIGASTSNGAFVLGPEATAALRVGIGPTLFADVGGTGTVLFLKQENKLRGVPGGTGGAWLGARF